MSSNTYSADLRPDPWLRIIVLTSGRLLIAAGLVVILVLELEVAARAAACLLWIGVGRFELWRVQRGFDYCVALRVFPSGEIALLNSDQEWVSGTLQTGSLVLRNFAWLRMQMDSGQIIVELLRGDARERADWRRLQVIRRHIGAGR